MRTLSDIDSTNEVKQIIRDLTIQRITEEIFTFESLTRKDYRRWKWGCNSRISIIKSIFEGGGVLTGSKVLSKSHIKGKVLLNRDTIDSDWDFIVTEENVYNITSQIDFIENYKSTHDDKKGILTYRILDGEYRSDKQYIDLIVVDELPLCHDVGELRYTDPLYIINQKMNIVQQGADGYKKHEADLKEFFWKFNYLVK
jgi:hypothetical protein